MNILFYALGCIDSSDSAAVKANLLITIVRKSISFESVKYQISWSGCGVELNLKLKTSPNNLLQLAIAGFSHSGFHSINSIWELIHKVLYSSARSFPRAMHFAGTHNGITIWNWMDGPLILCTRWQYNLKIVLEIIWLSDWKTCLRILIISEISLNEPSKMSFNSFE